MNENCSRNVKANKSWNGEEGLLLIESFIDYYLYIHELPNLA